MSGVMQSAHDGSDRHALAFGNFFIAQLGLRRQDLRKSLDAALDKIPRKLRETFVLFAEAGLSYVEIAAVQDVPIGTVMSRIYNARIKLQASLGQLEGL